MKYNLRAIMLRAWKNYRKMQLSFAECLHRAWLSAKAEEVNTKRIEKAKAAAGINEDTNTWSGWKQLGYEVQINKGSFMGRFGRTAQRTAFELLDHNLVTVVASDAHSPYQRTPWMQDVYQTLLEEYPGDYLEALFTENPGRICRGQEVIRFRRISFQDTYQI